MSNKRTNKRFVIGTPIIILDTKTNKNIEFLSISETARYFDTYPKTIWRIVYNDKLYLNRYKISVINNSEINRKIENKISLHKKFIFYKKCACKWIKENSYIIYYVLISIILIVIYSVLITYILLAFKDIYHDYISTIHSINYNYSNHMLYHNTNSKSNLIHNYVLNNSMGKDNKFLEVNREWFINAKLSIYQPIMNEVNLDFSSQGNYLIMNSVHSLNTSPIIERIDLNSVFNNMVINTAPIVESMDNNFLSINSNRNSLTLNTSIDLLRGQSRNKELLNYQSNILYLLINNLSPSLY